MSNPVPRLLWDRLLVGPDITSVSITTPYMRGAADERFDVIDSSTVGAHMASRLVLYKPRGSWVREEVRFSVWLNLPVVPILLPGGDVCVRKLGSLFLFHPPERRITPVGLDRVPARALFTGAYTQVLGIIFVPIARSEEGRFEAVWFGHLAAVSTEQNRVFLSVANACQIEEGGTEQLLLPVTVSFTTDDVAYALPGGGAVLLRSDKVLFFLP